jgi:hypothetical protein
MQTAPPAFGLKQGLNQNDEVITSIRTDVRRSGLGLLGRFRRNRHLRFTQETREKC